MEPRSPPLSVLRRAQRSRADPRRAPRMRRWLASTTLEVGLPLAEECADPFLRVLGLEGGGEPLRLVLEPLIEVAVRGDFLDLLDRQRCLAGELARPRQRRVE